MSIDKLDIYAPTGQELKDIFNKEDFRQHQELEELEKERKIQKFVDNINKYQQIEAEQKIEKDMDFINKIAIEAMKELISIFDVEGLTDMITKKSYAIAKAMHAQSKKIEQELLQEKENVSV